MSHLSVASSLSLLLLSTASCAADSDFFESRIRPLFESHCLECHNSDEAAGKLRLDVRAGWERGGESGPAIVPGEPASSLILRAVSGTDSNFRMPPEETDDQLTDREIADLVHWIRTGAPDPRDGTQVQTEIDVAAADHWAFQPVQIPEIPEMHHPVDYLIDRQLSLVGFKATQTADWRTLIRRATYDLHGLPPVTEQLQKDPSKFDQFIEQLLESPRYGERWGRHWLDVARYSDAKDGVLMYGDSRIRPFAYTYRDYVIRAFNEDRPFDQFIREQLAADQLGLPDDSPTLAAMGLLTLGRMFDNNRHDVIDDQIDVVTRGFLGLTVSCARCHDHKFDPVPTADYYSLYGVFASCVEPIDRPRIGLVSEEGQPFEKEFTDKLQEVRDLQKQRREETLATARERTADYLVAVATTEPDISETTIFFLSLIPEQLRPRITWRWRRLIARRAWPDDPVFGPWADLMSEPVLRPDEWKGRGIDPRIISGLVAANPQTPKEIARVYGNIIRQASEDSAADADDPLRVLLYSRDSPVWFPLEETHFYLSRQQKDSLRGLVGQLDGIAVKHPHAAARAMSVGDAEVLCDPVIFQRGDPASRGAPVPRQFLKILDPEQRPFATGGGRLELAAAIASPQNPLTARVWVNRVWMHHFGESLVGNPGDFGLRTPRPQHHELLDYLADYLMKTGWKTKPLHQLIMTSDAWQRSSIIPDSNQMAEQIRRDPDNRLIWHANRRRLDLEQMRDTLLFLSGQLDETMFGRPSTITDLGNHRRTVYAFVERQNVPSIVQTFDFASPDTSTSRRVTTTVPQQALFAMNSAFVAAAAKAMTASLPTEPAQAVHRLYDATLGRIPDSQEVSLSINFLKSGSAEQLAQVLLMGNELMFVD